MTDAKNEQGRMARRAAKRPLMKSPRFWVPTGIVLGILVLLGVVAAVLVPRGLTAKDSLEAAVPLATQAKDQILAGESEEAKLTVARLGELADTAVEATDHGLWRMAEGVPAVGENLRAVRIASESLSTLSSDVFAPATEVNLKALEPVDGAFNVQALADLLPLVEQAAVAANSVSAEIATLNQDQLLGPLQDGVVKLEDALSQLTDMVEPATTVLKILPAALGADGPKNYLLMFPNNAEVRAGGGNPAALAMLTAENGRISITQQASSADFGWENFPVNPETEELYGSRVKQQVQDITYTPYFNETAELMRGFWSSSFGTPVDAVMSFDPVALSYLLEATGPVTLATGDVLTAENVVPLMLNEVYIRFGDDGSQHDAFFSAATESIFSSVLSGGDSRALIAALARASDEGRLMFSSEDEEQMALIGAGRIAGPLPADNSEETVVGVFYNYVLAAKIDYYMDSTVTGETTQCVVEGSQPATFSATTTLTNNLPAEELQRLPWYVTGTNLGQGGSIYRDVLFYGPVGTTVQSVEANGTMVDPLDRWGNTYRELTHNGRPVVQIPMFVGMQETASVSVTFVAAADQAADSFGEFDVRATPTVRTTPVEVSRPGCE